MPTGLLHAQSPAVSMVMFGGIKCCPFPSLLGIGQAAAPATITNTLTLVLTARPSTPALCNTVALSPPRASPALTQETVRRTTWQW